MPQGSKEGLPAAAGALGLAQHSLISNHTHKDPAKMSLINSIGGETEVMTGARPSTQITINDASATINL